MNKRGFTLVELLAVVVVLAVVAVISIPIVLNIIENARRGALENSARGLMEAANNYYAIHSKDIEGYVDFSIVNGKQTSSEKLSYKGSIDNGYLRLVDAKVMALCIDDNKYFAVKNMDNDEIIVDEGVCSGEYDEELLGYVTIGNAAYIGTRLNVKAYASKNDLPNRSYEGYLGVITNTRINDYYLSPTAPENPKEGMVWIISSSVSENYIITKNSKTGVSYVLQYESGNWELKEAYVYNGQWDQLSGFTGSTYEWEFSYTGEYQTFTPPYSGYYTIELWGAEGSTRTNAGGKGAYTKGDLYLTAGESIYIYVGNKGTDGATTFNGSKGWAPGGGATDVRTQPTSSTAVWNEMASLRTRIMVAAGGGGGSKHSNVAVGTPGGGLTATSVASRGTAYGGTQTAGGAGAQSNYNGGNGSFGVAGNGNSGSGGYSGGGGGGWYGGGGGGVDGGADDDGAGAGGSSYISGHAGCNSVDINGYHMGSAISYTGKYFINTRMVDGAGYEWGSIRGANTSMPTHDGNNIMTGNTGDGFAKITFKEFESMTSEQYVALGAQQETLWTFPYLGYYQVFTAPKKGTYKIELWGSQGGNRSNAGGLGAYTAGNISLKKGQILYIYVGNQGGSGASTFNGSMGWSSGGGATDVRITPTSSTTTWREDASLITRIMVAAGGGGGSNQGSVAKGTVGGGLTATSISNRGTAYGGTQTAGGAGAQSNYNGNPGGFGYGGNGTSGSGGYSGGGGGGWYGGGAGGVDGGSDDDGAGAGGSSYISGHNGCIAIKENGTPKVSTSSGVEDSYSYTGFKFTDTKMIDGDGYMWFTAKNNLVKMPTYDGQSTMVGNTGNGYAKITFVD